ncbi:DNA-binding response regulator, OmpR family, contains REC and winged-helix (wHTH) domain [Belliella buryatensis]|uniref:DNA-binding response regulator, OmpR family, contains REC and winged-helix (WHTH) domain n=1 Tax=Belliella buryatensis TaxID=1500549 RepID=A0A239DKN5_9BACT|nr:response regulator transcription factor [Belliella buryatensis]SNS32611.1 DNA-binding response regulator, OmpR family, contains REC and winged-helix (wHTH) domain [Belliella buryatensis]
MKNSKILVIEDDARLASLLQRGLEESGMDVLLAYDGELGLKLFENSMPDLVITDLILPKINGLEVSKQLRTKNPQIPIIMLTALGTTDDKVEGFDAGADDYLVKPFDFRELLARIKTLLKRTQGLNSLSHHDEITYTDLKVDLLQKKVFRSGQEIMVTPKEFNLLKYLIQNPERVLSREEIAKEVWGVNFDTGTNFIDVYINYIRKKVDKPFEIKLIHTRPGMGFILQKS